MFGPHLIVDGSGCNRDKLGDRILVEQILNDYPAAIGMSKIGGPYMFEYQAPDPDYSGISGIVVIAESHIAIHTFPHLDYFTLDIFSCRSFDHEEAIEYIRRAFDPRDMDRMLVQRGLSFRGPHHGKQGAIAELIGKDVIRLESEEDQNNPGDLGRKSRMAMSTGGRMVWPRYGVTPDYGTYGLSARSGRAIRKRARPTIVDNDSIATAEGEWSGAHAWGAIEPLQVNATASISGLLDKLGQVGGQGRALGRALAIWEEMIRDGQETSIVLACSGPLVALGLRELLVYAVEHRYVDTLVMSAEDLFADLYEALGYIHYNLPDVMEVSGDLGQGRESRRREKERAGYDAVVSYFEDCLESLELAAGEGCSRLWHHIGVDLSRRAPRKGVLQAAAAQGVAVFTPDLGTSRLGRVMLGEQTRRTRLGRALGWGGEVVELAEMLGRKPRLGVIRVGVGEADRLVEQAMETGPDLGCELPTLSGSLSLGTALGLRPGERHVALTAEPEMTLPLLATGLAQRFPHSRSHRL